jgi:hypothetical protein
MPQFLNRFGRVAETASGAGFWKGLLTAMIELGALIGLLPNTNSYVPELSLTFLRRPEPRLSC